MGVDLVGGWLSDAHGLDLHRAARRANVEDDG
jgi:hypothetical protein